MSDYPTSLASPAEEALHTPSHGGMVTGHEYDVPINRRPTPSDLPTPTPRPQPVNGVRPRPLSMPMEPQKYASAGAEPAASSNAQSTNSHRESSRDGRSRQSRGTTNRSLGDYTLGKTLGAGSMGKVKLAYHNITGEKVCLTCGLSLKLV